MNTARLLAYALVSMIQSVSASAESLDEYLVRLDFAEVTFDGHIKFDTSSLNDNSFVFYDVNKEPFPVTVDAGRKTRQEIEEKCVTGSFMVSLSDMCQIAGLGTVEVRGSRIHLSIYEVTNLIAPN